VAADFSRKTQLQAVSYLGTFPAHSFFLRICPKLPETPLSEVRTVLLRKFTGMELVKKSRLL
jgi:hypothetical protein